MSEAKRNALEKAAALAVEAIRDAQADMVLRGPGTLTIDDIVIPISKVRLSFPRSDDAPDVDFLRLQRRP